MTGLDQDLMQKNLSCRNLQDAQKNMFWFTIAIVLVNVFFLSLGVLLYQFAAAKGIALPTNPATGAVIGDNVFPLLATNHFSLFAGIVFILGIIAVTYASADSALTALTTSFCVDMLGIGQYEEKKQKSIRQLTHFGFSVVLIVIILIFRAINDQSVITAVFKAAGYTYGPLLGLFSFGIFTSRGLHDKLVLPLCLLAPAAHLVHQRQLRGLVGLQVRLRDSDPQRPAHFPGPAGYFASPQPRIEPRGVGCCLEEWK